MTNSKRSTRLFSTFKRLKLFVRIVVPVFFFSCAKKEYTAPPSIQGLDYYPLQNGRYAVFECDSTVYTEIPRDTIHYRYQVKEVLSGPFTDDEGKHAWTLQRYIRWFDPMKAYDSLPWKIKDVWQVNATNKSIQVVEENVRYTRLSFPVRQGLAWNGNAANSTGEAQFTYEYVDQGETVGPEKFDRTLRVVGADARTLISYLYQSEKYAAGVGPVYKNYTEIYSNTIVSGQPVEQRIEKGVMFTQTLVSHGYQ